MPADNSCLVRCVSLLPRPARYRNCCANFSLWGYFYCAIATGNRPILIRCALQHPTGNASLTGRLLSIHHWAHPIRYCSADFGYCAVCISATSQRQPLSLRGPQGRGNLLYRYHAASELQEIPTSAHKGPPRNDILGGAVQEPDKHQFDSFVSVYHKNKNLTTTMLHAMF